ncbi:Uncharacterised protein (plasmid) [Tsukamurella tyrosinosolvens]|uniref:Uncharacterized protein n=2 Tax=Tsukamurella tyrosinosolvens TaxID=57704 RepID=A0A1H4U5K0_TSUTY|nr:hypothetical protein SAMN04489793_2790 [Tsukamurella tyrosinosolvens]VEH94008.1 Uncharacterised protein [Tsukamurella tyrosinosolvens]
MGDPWGWTSVPVCGVCGRDMGGTEIDHTPCFDRGRKRVELRASPDRRMDFRVRRLAFDGGQDPALPVEGTGPWDVCLQDDGQTLRLFRIIDKPSEPADRTEEAT